MNAEQRHNSVQNRSRERREYIELKVREVMLENPGISLKDLRERVHCGNGVLSSIYHRVRRGE